MATAIGNIIRAATRTLDEPLNILTFPSHERYESGLAKTNHNFYAIRADGVKDWNPIYAPRPTNYLLLNKPFGPEQIPFDICFDLMLCQNKFAQYHIARDICRQLHLPMVCLEHTLPPPELVKGLSAVKNMQGDVNIFISEYSRNAWGWAENEAQVIHHGVDTDLFCPNDNLPRQIHVLSVVNDFVNRDWCCGYSVWRQVTDGLPVRLLGDTPQLGAKAAQSVPELINAYHSCRVFLNTSLISPVPTVLLEAMACGCPVVSTNTCMIPDIITDGKNGFLCDTVEELRKKTELLLEDVELGRKLGNAARQTICERFNLSRFIEDWKKVFIKAANIVFTGEKYAS